MPQVKGQRAPYRRCSQRGRERGFGQTKDTQEKLSAASAGPRMSSAVSKLVAIPVATVPLAAGLLLPCLREETGGGWGCLEKGRAVCHLGLALDVKRWALLWRRRLSKAFHTPPLSLHACPLHEAGVEAVGQLVRSQSPVRLNDEGGSSSRALPSRMRTGREKEGPRAWELQTEGAEVRGSRKAATSVGSRRGVWGTYGAGRLG